MNAMSGGDSDHDLDVEPSTGGSFRIDWWDGLSVPAGGVGCSVGWDFSEGSSASGGLLVRDSRGLRVAWLGSGPQPRMARSKPVALGARLDDVRPEGESVDDGS